jgi:hypothetical protein
LSFHLTAPGKTITFDITPWKIGLTDEIYSTKGRCVFENTNLTLIPNDNDSYVVCTFFTISNIIYPMVQITDPTTGGIIQFPQMVYFSVPFEFNPITTSCSDPFLSEQCHGTFIFPTKALPISIQTTSAISIIENTSDNSSQIELINDQSGMIQTTVVYNYRIDVRDNIAINTDYISFDAILLKSLISPHLHFYSNGLYMGQSRSPVYTDISIKQHTDCALRTGNLCTLIVTVNSDTPNADQITISPQAYLIPTTSKPDLCPSEIQTSNDHSLLFCQTFRKTLHTDATRAALNNIIPLTITGPYYSADYDLPIADTIYISPLWVDFDLDLCAAHDSPVCVASVKSIYRGPSLEVVVDVPFAASIDRIECNSNQMSIHTNILYLPSRDAATNPNQFVYVPEGLPYNECKFFFLTGYKQPLDYGKDGDKISLLAYREKNGGWVRGKIASLPLPASATLTYDVFPYQIKANQDCSDKAISICTLVISAQPTLAKENFPRSFVIWLPGIDIEYTLQYEAYSISIDGFASSTATMSTTLYEAGHPNNPMNERIVVFEVTLNTLDNHNVYFSPDAPATITITYRLTPSTLVDKAVPTFLSYGGVPMDIQPTLSELMPDTPDGFYLIWRPDDALTFFDNCSDSTINICTVAVQRWVPTQLYTYFLVEYSSSDPNFDPSLVPPVIGLKDDLNRFVVEIAPIADMGNGTPGGSARINWTQFKKDPSDPNEPLPDYVQMHFLSSLLGSRSLLSITVLKMTSDYKKVIGKDNYTKPSQFNRDAFPVFDYTSCSSPIDPNCVADYEFKNSVPPHWYLITHDLPSPNFVYEAYIESCTNTPNNEIPFTLTLTRAGDVGFGGAVYEKDTITISNQNTFAIFPKDLSKIMSCRVVFVLHNAVSPPRYRTVPHVIMNYTRSLYDGQESIFLPKMAWAPTTVVAYEDCLSHSTTESVCTAAITFYGTASKPIQTLSQILPADFLTHPLISPGKYLLHTKPIPESEWEANQDLIAVTMELAFIPNTDLRKFSFTILPQFQTKTFTAYILFTNPVQIAPNGDLISFAVPRFDLPLDLNESGYKIPSNFHVPAMTSGPIMTIIANQTRFSSPGIAHGSIRFGFNVLTAHIETNLGNVNPIPCIQTDSYSATMFSSSSSGAHFYTVFSQIASLPTVEKQLEEFQKLISNGTFNNDQITSPSILGWFEPALKLNDPNGTTTFTANINVPDGIVQKSCYYFFNVNSRYPIRTNDVRHTIKVSTTGIKDETLLVVHDYPQYTASANIYSISSETNTK